MHGLRRAGQHDITRPRPQPMPPRLRNPIAQRDRQQQQAGPEETMKGEIGGRKADGDAVLGGDETGGPAERRGDAAQGPDQDGGPARRRRLTA